MTFPFNGNIICYGGFRANNRIVVRRTINGRVEDWLSGNSYDWGAENSGSQSLAHEILLDFTGDQKTASAHYVEFSRQFVESFPKSRWVLGGSEIAAWLADRPNPVTMEEFFTFLKAFLP